MRAVRTVGEVLALGPEFVVAAVSWPAMPGVVRELVAAGAKVLAETPPAPDLATRAKHPIYATAMTAEEAGERVLNGIRRNDMYILTHPEIRKMLETRAQALIAALPDEPPNEARIAAMGETRHLALYEEQIAKPPPTAP